MLRILVAAIVLLAAAWFYLNQGGSENARPLEAQQQALEKAKEVEKVVQDQADALKQQIEEQTAEAETALDDDGRP
ncbi:MAG TPA: hypothetical protein VF267_11070 [Gammaproteobacteria bacterium]